VAGVALGGIDRHFVWHPCAAVVAAALCVAGVALGDIDLRFAWQAVLGDIDRHFAWQAWHLRGRPSTVTLRGPFAAVVAAAVCVALDNTLCGRCGTYGIGLAPVICLGPLCRRCRSIRCLQSVTFNTFNVFSP